MSTLHAYYADRIKDRAGNTLFLLVMNIILMTALVLWTALGLVLFPILFVFHKYIAKDHVLDHPVGHLGIRTGMAVFHPVVRNL